MPALEKGGHLSPFRVKIMETSCKFDLFALYCNTI